ncbi:ImmA/IrrE family metallo-endopeptidase [Xanthobacter sp. 91]|uniref:ImmA/IrrE family metallo-endopeptidase n=1 Tax=Xanthobacter sp. 91 TaxID=1117244 RepID=UPI0004953FC9
MASVHLIRTADEYKAALARAEEIMDAEPGTPLGDELEHLAMVIEAYEEKHYPIGLPDPISAIQFRMEQEGLSNKDLTPYLGSSAKVSEVLSGKRDLTLPMIRALNKHLGIPAEVLIQEQGGSIPDDVEGLDWGRFPVTEMVKRGFIAAHKNAKANAEFLIRGLMDRAGGFEVAAPLCRKSDGARRNAKMDSYALAGWCMHVLSEAQMRSHTHNYRKGVISHAFLRKVAKLSAFDDGPKRAEMFLAEHGIRLIVAPHLSNTYLDGAAMLLADGTPVIGMTLRYDRLDNFWFCLLHELTHVARHLADGSERMFVDDLDLRAKDDDEREREADEWAEEALIPRKEWDAHPAQDAPYPSNVISLAQRVGVHPAIVAGRIRWRDRNYRILSQFVGAGEVRRHFKGHWN